MIVPSRLAAVALIAAASLLAPAASLASPVTQKGVVTAIVDGRTLQVRLTGGKGERIQLTGLAAPGSMSCAAVQSEADLAHLAQGKLVWIVAETSHGAHSSGSALVAYVFLPGGLDLGLQLVKRGDASVAGGKHSFKQAAAYL